MNTLVRFEENIAYVDNQNDPNFSLDQAWMEITNNMICKDSSFLVVYNFDCTTLEEFANVCNKKEEYQYLMISNYLYDIQVPAEQPYTYEMIDDDVIISFKNPDDHESQFALDILVFSSPNIGDDCKTIHIHAFDGKVTDYSITDFARRYNLMYVLKNHLIRQVLDIQ
jgi:hypothetical protein